MKEFFSLRKKSYTLSPHFVKRKAHDRTEKSATEQSGKRGNPRRSSANFCGIRRTPAAAFRRKNRSKYPSKGLKGEKPEFRLNRRATRASASSRRENPRREFPARKKPEAGLAEKPSGEPLKKPRSDPRKAPAANPNKKSPPRVPLPPRYWLEVSNAESNAISERGKSNERTRAADSVAPWTLSMRPSSHSTESGPL